MPAVRTSKPERTVTTTGSGAFGGDPTTVHNGASATRYQARPYTILHWWGLRTRVQARVSLSEFADGYEYDGGTNQHRYGFTVTVEASREDFNADTLAWDVTASDTWTASDVTDWYPGASALLAGSGGLLFDRPALQCVGEHEFTEMATLAEWLRVDPAGDHLPFEVKRVDSFTHIVTLDAVVVYQGDATHLAFSESYTYDEADFGDQAVRYGHKLEALDVGFNQFISAALSHSDATLNSLYAGDVSATHGHLVLTGDPHSISVEWQGNLTTDLALYADPGGAGTQTPLTASLYAEPSWAEQVTALTKDYGTGLLTPVAMRHGFRLSNILHLPGEFDTSKFYVGGFSSSDPYRYPATGWLGTVVSRAFDGNASYPDAGPVIDGDGNDLTGANVVAPFLQPTEVAAQIAISDPLYLGDQEFVGQTFEADLSEEQTPYWASEHFRGEGRLDPSELWPRIGPAYPVGTLNFAASHPFTLFSTAANWDSYADADFVAANPTFTGTAALSTVSGHLRAVVTGGRALITTTERSGVGDPGMADNYRLRHFGFRYAQLQLTCDVPGAVLRFALGGPDFSIGSWQSPRWAWEITLTGDGEPETHEIDLMLPTLSSLGEDIPGDVITWEPFTGTLPPGRFLRLHETPGGFSTYRDGATVWVEFPTAGTYELLGLTGIRKDTDRTPLRIVYPTDGHGDLQTNQAPVQGTLPEYEPAEMREPVGSLARWFVQGAYGGDLAHPTYFADGLTDPVLLADLLAEAKARLEVDSGITLTLGAADWLAAPALGSGELEPAYDAAGFGHTLTAGTPWEVPGQLRRQFPAAYPGQGAQDGGPHGRLIEFVVEATVGGEVCGILNRAGRPVVGASVELRDNDTEAVLHSATADADGAFRLFGPYGVKFPRANADRTVPGPEVPDTDPLYPLLVSHWLAGKRLAEPKDASGLVLDRLNYPAVIHRRDVQILCRWPGLLTEIRGRSAGALANAHHPAWGWYVALDTLLAAGVRLRRSQWSYGPPWVLTAQLTADGSDAQPDAAFDLKDGRLWVLWTRGSDVLFATSTDAGQSINEEAVMFTNGEMPAVRFSDHGPGVAVSFRAGALVGKIKFPGESEFGAEFTLTDGTDPLVVAGEGFDLSWSHDAQGSLLLACVVEGEVEVSHWRSFDSGRTFARVVE
jgi:hypothetical protein